jgi:hypothetical protein
VKRFAYLWKHLLFLTTVFPFALITLFFRFTLQNPTTTKIQAVASRPFQVMLFLAVVLGLAQNHSMFVCTRTTSPLTTSVTGSLSKHPFPIISYFMTVDVLKKKEKGRAGPLRARDCLSYPCGILTKNSLSISFTNREHPDDGDRCPRLCRLPLLVLERAGGLGQHDWGDLLCHVVESKEGKRGA